MKRKCCKLLVSLDCLIMFMYVGQLLLQSADLVPCLNLRTPRCYWAYRNPEYHFWMFLVGDG